MFPDVSKSIALCTMCVRIALIVSFAAAAITVESASAATMPLLLMGTEYKVSGFNSYLPDSTKPDIVKFDGKGTTVGSYSLKESVHQFVNNQGKMETWVDFAFNRLGVGFETPLAVNENAPWEVSLTDLDLPDGARVPEFYMYFTYNEAPRPFKRLPPPVGTPDPFPIGKHPFLTNVDVWRDQLNMIKPAVYFPGGRETLVMRFENFRTTMQELGVSTLVEGFHLGYRIDRIEVPEPATCAYVLAALVAGAWTLRRRARSESLCHSGAYRGDCSFAYSKGQ